MTIEDERLLLAKYDQENYANAFIFQYLIITASHIIGDGLSIETPRGDERGFYTFNRHQSRDLAHSLERVLIQGFDESAMPDIDDQVWVFGHHGPERSPFVIDAVVHSFSPKGRIIIKRLEGKKFQLGMSGCPVIDSKNRLVGVLVEGVKGAGGEMVYLEPAIAL